MSIEVDGYLSFKKSPRNVRRIRRHYRQEFQLVHRLNRVGQRRFMAVTCPPDDNIALLVLLLFARTLSAFQGAAIMAERGMIIEARTLARSCFESVFVLGALENDPTFVDRLVGADNSYRKHAADTLKSNSHLYSHLTPNQKLEIEKLQEFLSDPDTKLAKIIFDQAASKAGLDGQYEMFYRELSYNAAHPTVESLRQHLIFDSQDNVVSLRFVPDRSELSTVVAEMTTALFTALGLLDKRFPMPETDAEFEACWRLHLGLRLSIGMVAPLKP